MNRLIGIRALGPGGDRNPVVGFGRAGLLRTKAHLIVMSVIFAGALVVGYLLLPGVNERIAMLERDGQHRQALRILEQRFQAGDRSQRTLFQLQRIYEDFGDLTNARTMLELLAEQRPKDPQVQRQLSLFYKNTQDSAGYIKTLEMRLQSRYAETLCKELIGLYRSAGDYAAEQRKLQECRLQGYRRPDDIIRLAYLVAADGDLAQSAQLLRSVDDRRRLRIDRDRMMLFVSLLEANEAVDAQRRAMRWLKASKDDALALLLIDNLAKDGRHDLAIDLARSVGTAGDSVSLSVAELMLDRDQTLAARSYLRGWMEQARIRDADVAQRFISASLDTEDPELAFIGAEKFGLKRLAQSDLTALAEALSAVGRRAEFQKVRDAIDPEILRDNPLLAAASEFERGAAEPARQLLSRVQVDGLDEWRLALWARLMELTGRGAAATQVIRDIRAEVQPAPSRVQSRVIRRATPLDRRTPRRSRFRRPAQLPPAAAKVQPFFTPFPKAFQQ